MRSEGPADPSRDDDLGHDATDAPLRGASDQTGAPADPSPERAGGGTEAPPRSDDPDRGARRPGWRDRLTWATLPTALLAAWVVAAFPLILFKIGRYHWFFRDDWIFLTQRREVGISTLLEPWNAHWVAVPNLCFNVMWRLVGLRSYRPYQAMAVFAHLTVVVLLFLLMRRARVNAWIAAAIAGAFVLFGPGDQNIVWAFQIGFTGSLALGLAQMVAADHDGPVDRRDLLAAGIGVVAVATSGPSVVFVALVALATFVRRGWKPAAVVSVPAAVVYGLWAATQHPQSESPFGRPPVGVMWDWVYEGVVSAVKAIGHYRPLAILIGIVLVVGLLVAWLPPTREHFRTARSRYASCTALLLGSVVFPVVVSQGRWISGIEAVRQSRYLYTSAMFLLPALGVAVDALVRKAPAKLAPVALVAGMALVLVGAPGNARQFDKFPFGHQYMEQERNLTLTAAAVPGIQDLPPDISPAPSPYGAPDLGVLALAKADGTLPALPRPTPMEIRHYRVRFAIQQEANKGYPLGCRTQTKPVDLTTKRGERFVFNKPMLISSRGADGPNAMPVTYDPRFGALLKVQMSGIPIQIRSAEAGRPFTICRS